MRLQHPMASQLWYQNPDIQHERQWLILTTQSAKQAKNYRKGWATAFINLAPHTSAGITDTKGRLINLCPKAKVCQDVCLQFAGRNRMSGSGEARYQRTMWLHYDRKGFLNRLGDELHNFHAINSEKGLKVACRPNALSDLPWLAEWCSTNFKNITFYDYTKLPKPWQRTRDNYHLTFSYDGTPDNKSTAWHAISGGMNVAVVFDKVPDKWKLWEREFPVINGDADDLRFLDDPFRIIGLKAKAMARKLDTGFVQKGA